MGNRKLLPRFIKSLFFIIASVHWTTAETDLTTVHNGSGLEIVDAVLGKLERESSFLPSYMFLRRIAFVESKYGTSPLTYREEYHGGIWQVDEDKYNYTVEYLRSLPKLNHTSTGLVLARTLLKDSGIRLSNVTWRDLRSPYYSGLFCTMYFYIVMNVSESHHFPLSVTAQSNSWKEHYRPESASSVFRQEVSKMHHECRNRRTYVLFLLDSSTSLGIRNFRYALEFVADVSADLQNISERVRVALMTYASNFTVQFNFTQFQKTPQTQKRILSTKYTRGNTYSGEAIQKAIQLFNRSSAEISNTEEFHCILILITDGKSSDDVKTPSQQAFSRGINVYAIGVGEKIDLTTLRRIVNDEISRIFRVTRYERLKSYINDAVLRKICKATLLSFHDSIYIESPILPKRVSGTPPWKKSPTSTCYSVIVEDNFLVCVEAMFRNQSTCSDNTSQQKVSIFASNNNAFTNSVLYQAKADVKFSCDLGITTNGLQEKDIYFSGVLRRISGCVLVQPHASNLLGNFPLNRNVSQAGYYSSSLEKDNRHISQSVINIAVLPQSFDLPFSSLLFIYKIQVNEDIASDKMHKTGAPIQYNQTPLASTIKTARKNVSSAFMRNTESVTIVTTLLRSEIDQTEQRSMSKTTVAFITVTSGLCGAAILISLLKWFLSKGRKKRRSRVNPSS